MQDWDITKSYSVITYLQICLISPCNFYNLSLNQLLQTCARFISILTIIVSIQKRFQNIYSHKVKLRKSYLLYSVIYFTCEAFHILLIRRVPPPSIVKFVPSILKILRTKDVNTMTLQSTWTSWSIDPITTSHVCNYFSSWHFLLLGTADVKEP